jgi:hypothetical protein
MAEKIDKNLYYDERSAGGIVYKKEKNKIFWLLIKTVGRKKDREIYKFPKGHLKKDEYLKGAAMRGVEEEGKIKAKIISKLGSNNYIIWDTILKRKIIKKVTFFLMEYIEESHLKYYDTEMVLGQEWLAMEKAMENLAFASEKVLLKKANDLIKE